MQISNLLEVEQVVRELQNELVLLRGVIQVIGLELQQINQSPKRMFIDGHVIFYDNVPARYVVDYTLQMTYEELCQFLTLQSDSVEITQLLAMTSAVATKLQLVPRTAQ